jgi:hypothetical protein
MEIVSDAGEHVGRFYFSLGKIRKQLLVGDTRAPGRHGDLKATVESSLDQVTCVNNWNISINGHTVLKFKY